MNKALTKLAIAVELLKIAIRTELLKLLGVERMVKDAFIEGHTMACDHEGIHCYWEGEQAFVEVIHVWKSVDEAWANSDAQEMFE